MKDREEEQKTLEAAGVADAESHVLKMEDRGQTVGYVIVALEGKTLHIRKLWAEGYDSAAKPQGEEIFILDTLMRSAASYGETFGAEEIVTDFPDFYEFFRVRGFQTDETHAFTPMSTIVHYENGGV